MVRCSLVLEDGTVLEGVAFGDRKDVFGEVVFNTGMTGHQELISDPSCSGQIVISSYPLVGNCGASPGFMQSGSVHARGLVARELCDHPSRMYGGGSFDDFLKASGVPGISGLDTRDLVITIREKGSMRGAISCREDHAALIEELRRSPFPHEGDLVSAHSPKEVRSIDNGRGLRVGILDCGCKNAIIRQLSSRFDLARLPHDISAGEAMGLGLDGLVASSGPGDPAHPSLRGTVETLREMAHAMPVMGIGLGCQLLALAFGGETRRMPVGHRGAGHPVSVGGRIIMTAQHHGFEIVGDSLRGGGLVPDQFNINDGGVEGVSHEDLPVFGVQYHPEASPGPNDGSFLFDRLLGMMEARP